LLPELRVLTSTGEPGTILDAWAGVELAVVVDAASTDDSVPGRIRRWTPGAVAASPGTSSHAFGLPQTYALGQALGRLPNSLVVFTVDIADAALGPRFSAPVAAAGPEVVDTILAEFGMARHRDLRRAIED
jgi:hydrogenase maturation protease